MRHVREAYKAQDYLYHVGARHKDCFALDCAQDVDAVLGQAVARAEQQKIFCERAKPYAAPPL